MQKLDMQQSIRYLQGPFPRREEEMRRHRREKLQALDSLSTYDYQSSFQTVQRYSAHGTWQWIIDDPQIREWILGSSRCLWLTGRFSWQLSMISNFVASHLLILIKSGLKKGDLVAFFSCDSHKPDSLQHEIIVGSVIRQLLNDLPAQRFEKFSQKHNSRDQILDFVRGNLAPGNQYFIVLDGFHRCKEGQIREVLEMFRYLISSGFGLKIFLSGTLRSYHELLLQKFPAQQRISLDNGEIQFKVTANMQKIADMQESAQGTEAEIIILGKFWLGCQLSHQQKYVEAEQLLRQAVQGKGSLVGIEHADTVDYKYMLSYTLYMQRKYVEAEQLLRQVVQANEKGLVAQHEHTLSPKFLLGLTLPKNQKYIEAEHVLRQVVQEYEETLCAGHEDTIASKCKLGFTLYKQQKYVEAEQLFRQVVKGNDELLGVDHKDTLYSRCQLGTTLYQQQKYIEAEQLFQQLIQGNERVLGAEDELIIRVKRVLRLTKQKLASSATLDTTQKNAAYSGLNEFFTDARTQYSDAEIVQISSLLNRLNPVWAQVPRTYTILRVIDCQEHLDDFIDLGFSDHWFPITEKGIPSCLSPDQRRRFVSAQHLVITPSLDLEKGEKGQHAYFNKDDTLPFEQKGILGSGGFGQVDKVLSLVSFREYARKRVSRSRAFGARQTESVRQFVAEITILKRLKHEHVVKFVGSYTDHKYIGLLMSPIAEMDLSKYLAKVSSAQYGELRTFFGCLARALEFLHDQGVRHKDIKPSNILLDRGNILFTDFGLSLDFSALDGSTTASMVNGMTPRYCAPEVARQEARNTASDVWSLGIVFLEMIIALKEKPVEYIKDFFKTHGSHEDFVRTNPDALIELVAELKGSADRSDDRVFGWVQSMLQEQQKRRPTAAALVISIVAPSRPEDGDGRYCGICCVDPDDDNEVGSVTNDFEGHLRI